MKSVYYFRALCLFAIVLIAAGCNNSTEPQMAQISINTNSLSFTQMDSQKIIVISNPGDPALHWTITSKPDWLTVSKFLGEVKSAPDTVLTTAGIQTPVGNYSGKIVIEYNGGIQEISISYSVQFNVAVFPGEEAAEIKLGETYNWIIDVHGFSDTFITVFDNNGAITGHIVLYQSLGIEFLVEGMELTPEFTNPVRRIMLKSPYDGVTDRFVGISNSLREVENAYGTPDAIDSTSGCYEYSAGIRFRYTPGSTFITTIEIF